jgi:hypothetical protein
LQQHVPTITSLYTGATMCFNNYLSSQRCKAVFQKKKKKIPGHESCPVPRKTQQTDNHGLAPKAFFAHKERLKMDLTNKEYKGAVWTRVAQDRVLGS